MFFEMYTAFRGKVIIKDEYKELVELINTGSWEEAALKFPFVKEYIKVNRSTDISFTALPERESPSPLGRG
ncbi:hypothetical protein [Bacillus wiedmannii]|uniref:Uncharacterized protein n=1 Tax=Bacillus wiedmannii TaxID=1890302 RepID=A0A242ZMI2_9BACI|nr:hypothetical protein [Bacillus wiedmannii]MED3126624.1 hypothetical protein [Bacillus wiedmannii]OTX97195.1 hypothetical protein BK730_02365 [Bacillus wiedmannii]